MNRLNKKLSVGQRTYLIEQSRGNFNQEIGQMDYDIIPKPNFTQNLL
jgi:hypothetical protein